LNRAAGQAVERPERRTARLMQDRLRRSRVVWSAARVAGTRTPHPSRGSGLAPSSRCALRCKKEHTPSPLSHRRVWFGRPQDFMRTLADWLGSAVKPLMESGKRVWLGSRKRPFRHEKTHFRVEVGRMRLR
jgi:hypothetical protein